MTALLIIYGLAAVILGVVADVGRGMAVKVAVGALNPLLVGVLAGALLRSKAWELFTAVMLGAGLAFTTPFWPELMGAMMIKTSISLENAWATATVVHGLVQFAIALVGKKLGETARARAAPAKAA